MTLPNRSSSRVRRGDTATERLAAEVAGGLGALSRRGLMRTAGASALGVSGAGLLASCGTEGTKQSADSCKSTDISADEKTLNFSNWPEYLDQSEDEEDVYPTLADFEEQTGIEVTYATDINDNNEFFAKVRNQLGDCQATERDIFVLTDWMAARMIGSGWIQRLNDDNIPNVRANLVDSLRDLAWDKGRTYSVPWQSGLTGIAYNAKVTGEVASFEELVTRADLKGKISLLTEMGDTMAFVIKLNGADPETFTDEEWKAGLAKLEEIVASGQVRKFTGNAYVEDLATGNLAACLAWSGDVLQMQFEDPDIKFVIPSEGLGLWSDNMMVPNKADHKANAEALMNYYYEPEVAARLAAWVNYICPVKGAQEAMAEIDEELAQSPLIFPTASDLANTFAFKATDTKTREKWDKEFNQVIGA
ncbi:MAG: ABC transporter substrate-binding protein [Nocardioides sp.]